MHLYFWCGGASISFLFLVYFSFVSLLSVCLTIFYLFFFFVFFLTFFNVYLFSLHFYFPLSHALLSLSFFFSTIFPSLLFSPLLTIFLPPISLNRNIIVLYAHFFNPCKINHIFGRTPTFDHI